jgi:hypothetical protein
VTEGGVVIVRAGDAVGTPPLVASPWSLTTTLERRWVRLAGLATTLRLEDVFHAHNPGPFYTSDPASPYFAPGLRSDPATNVLNLRLDARSEQLDLALYLDNAFNSQPTLLTRNKGNDLSTLFYATTLRPRTVGLSATWHFQ